MNPSVYLKAGDLITISHQGLFLAIQSLTQSVPKMKQLVSNPINAIFLLTTQKCIEKSSQEQKPLIAYNDDDIYYNQPIVLYHLLSGKFLSYSKDIENKASVELISTFKDNCKFSIKPIFKCQTVITRKIRNQQSVVISPAETYNHQGNIALVVLRNENRKGDQSYVLMKKNQNSKFLLARKNEYAIPQNSISNIYIYQLLNIETKKNLYMSLNPTKHKQMITFEKSINQFGSYFDIRPKQSSYATTGVTEKQIQYGMPIYIHSWKENKYLSINIIGDACLTEIPNEESQFVIESYSDLQLNKDSVVRIKHLLSKKYLSLNPQGPEVQMTHQLKLIDTYFIVKVPIEELRLNVFINDAHEIIQNELSAKTISYRNRKNIFKVLKQLTIFIYGDQVTTSQFLSMKNKVACKLPSNDQKLLANIGIIDTLLKMCRIFIQQITKEPEGSEFERKDKTEQQTIIIYTMMSLVGVCNKNSANTRILVQQMPLLYQSLVSVTGIIESLYNLFKDSKELLLILENTSHRVGRKDLPSMQVLINMLIGHKMDIPTKCKIIKLLDVLIIVNHKEKILGHQTILLRSLLENKLDNVMIPMKTNDHEDLLIFVEQKNAFDELEQILSLKRTYQKQLELVKTQLELLCSLCLNSSFQCFAYAKKIITEQMLYRYLKGNLQPDFKEIFMRLLIDIYLSNLASRNYSMSKSFVISNQDKPRKTQYSKVEESIRDNLLSQEGQQMVQFTKATPSHSKIIEKIQNLILQQTKKAIINEIIDSSFYMNIKSLRKFLDLRILDRQQVSQFRSLLTQYITKYSKTSFKEEEKRKIVLEIIKIMTDYVSHQIQAISEQFIYMLRDEDIPEAKIYERFLNFISHYTFFNPQVQAQMLRFLPPLIKQSIQFNDTKVLIAASSLMKMINQRASIFISQLKDKIIIDSKWSVDFYNKVSKIKKELSKQIHQYMNHKSDHKQLQFIEQQLNQQVKQLNYLFFDAQNSHNQFSELTQNIYREMNLLEIIVNFLNESQQKFKQVSKTNANDIYSTCFEFIGLYLQDNRQNFHRFQQKYLDIKFVFEHPDRGQIKFLNSLIKMPNARDLMLDEIIQCILLSFQHNPQPSPYTILALVNSISNPHYDKQKIQILVEKMMREPRVFQSILKVMQKRDSYVFTYSFSTEAQNYHKDWLLYCYLLIKLLLILLEQSIERTSLALEIQKYISLSSLIQLLKCQDLITNTSMSSLQGTLLKNQIMKLCLKNYMPLIQKERNQIQNILAFVHQSLQSLSYIKESHGGASQQLIQQVLQKSSEHGSIIFEAQIQSKSRISMKDFQINFNTNYLAIVKYFPFLIRTLDTLLNSNPHVQSEQTLKKQTGIQMDSTYRKMKQFLQSKLTYGEFNKNSKEYHAAISNCEDLFKRKLGFNMSIEENQQDEDIGEIQVTDYFINNKIQNTIKCYKFAYDKNEKKIYEAFINIFHSQKFRGYMLQDEQNLSVHLTIEQMNKITEMFTKYVASDNDKFAETIKLFSFFARFNKDLCLRMVFNSSRQVIMTILSNEKEDSGNEKLCNYLAVSLQLFKWEIQKDHQIQKKSQGYYPFKNDFMNRICKRIEAERIMHVSSKINEQAIIYSQNGLLSYQRVNQYLSIQLCLEWIRNAGIITPLKVKQKLYSALFMEVVDLLKAYSNFIKQFNSKYISYQIYNKINLCLEIIFHFIAGITHKSIFVNYLIQRQIWNDLNLILGLDDGWARNLDQLEDSQSQIFTKVIRNQLRANSRIFLKQAEKIYLNTKKFYKNLIPQKCYPLLPKKSLFGEAKSNIINVFKQFKHFPLQIKQQLFSRIQIPIVNKNIFEVYKKHNKLFNQYGIPSVEVDIDYTQRNEWRQVVDNMVFQNGVDLTSLKMHIGTISGSTQIKTQYDNLRVQSMNSKKIQSAFSTLFTFFKDFFLLFISCFLSLCRKKKETERKDEQQIDEKRMLSILNFFLTKIGRAQVKMSQSELLSVDFMIRPECALNKETKDKFIQKINFISMQLKLQSIYSQAQRFLLYFENEIDFYRRFNRFAFVTFLTKNFDMITYINFAVIVAQNIILIANSSSKDQYFISTSLDQPFVWLQIISTIIAGLIMFAYCIKDVHLLVKNINLVLKIRAESYGSNYNSYNPLIKLGIKLSMIMLDPTFAYHFIYTFIVGLVFYNKLFAALLLLDIFFQIPTLKNLLMSIWRPKIQLILAIVSFILVQYFFSIFMFFNFKKQTLGYCETLGECFGFVFVTTYKAVGGFVGYLFLKTGGEITPVNFFEVFQDVYVVLIFQIFFALILAIIIDTFSLIRNEQTVRKQYLDGCCIVCNLDKTKFNSSNMSFKAHIAITHNIWNYFYYYEYVFHKPAFKRTPSEREIFLNRNANWLPIDASFDVVEDKQTIMGEPQALPIAMQ